MKKKRSPALKTLLLLSIGAGVIAGFILFDPDVKNIGSVLEAVEPQWLMLALVCMAAYYLIDSAVYVLASRDMGAKLRFFDGLLIALIGFFYSAITPLATGGQPFQAIEMKKRGMKVGTATSVLMVRFLAWHISLTAIGLAGFAFVAGELWAESPTLFVMFLVGVITHLVCIGVGAALMIKPQWMRATGDRAARWAGRTFFRNDPHRPDRLSAAWLGFVDDYMCAVGYVKAHLWGMLGILGLAALEVAAYMSVTYFVYRGMGFMGVSYITLMAFQAILFIAVAFIPLPGASGASETGFYALFTRFFGAARLAGMLCWRVLTYYLTILLGILAVTVSGIRTGKGEGGIYVSDR